jgi:ankyrin repeat protein
MVHKIQNLLLGFPFHAHYSLSICSFPTDITAQIMLAAYHGHAPLVKLLLEHGANPNTLNDRGQSPLAGAVFKGETDVVEVTCPHSCSFS